jgi:hypothetical protein
MKGADVEVVCGKCRLKGKVSYYRHSALGYDVGVAFNPKCGWNRKRFAPKHLLEIPAIMAAAGLRDTSDRAWCSTLR